MPAMTITAKTAAALLAIFVVLLSSMAVILNSAVLPGFNKLEVQAHARDVARVQANLEALTRNMQTRALDYAQWDDTYAFLGGGGGDYISSNFQDNWFADYDVDILAFYDDRGRLLWTRMRTASGEVIEGVQAASDVLNTAPPIRVAGEATPTILWTADGPLLGIVAPGTRSDGGGAPRGAIVLGKRISVEALRDQTQINVQFVRPGAAPPDLEARLMGLVHAPTLSWTVADSVHALIALRDGHGALVGAVAMNRSRAILAQGERAIGIALVLFAALAAIAVAALWILLRQMVIARVVRLERHLNLQSNTKDMQQVPVGRSRDELARLAMAYNALASRVYDANNRARDANTEREAAAAANRMKSEFLANISHELRAPLNSVIGYTELVQEELDADGVHFVADDLDRIAGAGRQLLALVNEIFDLSKIEAGRLEITPGSFLVKELVDSVVDAVRPLAIQNDNTLRIDLAPDLGAAYSDEARLRQCLINVLSNACRFGNGSVVSLNVEREVRHDGDWLRFSIRDQGVGMSAAQLARVFEPFVEADASISRRFGGTGLGLAITRKIMTLLGGTIEATSVEGAGSEFVLFAPANAWESEMAWPKQEQGVAA